ncbi:Uncharacterised protein [Vibrio cholerae]|nr:Uncharacterised protein [Vibrio cholerae]
MPVGQFHRQNSPANAELNPLHQRKYLVIVQQPLELVSPNASP